jgi:hypothetical protein
MLALLLLAQVADPPRFRWQTGDALTYTAKQTTAVSETTRDDATGAPVAAATTTTLTVTRRWTVTAVDAAGVGTATMTVVGMKQEIVRPGPRDKDGKPTVDRVILDSDAADGREAMAAFLGKPVVTATVDRLGRVVSATVTSGSAERVKAELPFRLVLPEAAPSVGTVWDRPFALKLDPPHGTGESYDFVQTFTLKGQADGHLVIGLTTALRSPPKDPAELPPLVPFLWEGDVFFHPPTGRYAGARLSVKREVPNHQGDGTKFVYESKYEEGVGK